MRIRRSLTGGAGRRITYVRRTLSVTCGKLNAGKQSVSTNNSSSSSSSYSTNNTSINGNWTNYGGKRNGNGKSNVSSKSGDCLNGPKKPKD